MAIKKINPLAIVGIILLFGLLLRAYNLNGILWRDEYWYSTHIFMQNSTQLLKDILFNHSAPLYRIFMFFWIKLFGDFEVSIRIPPLACGILSVFLTYLIALKSTENTTAIFATFLLCISPVHILYSRTATPYSMLLLIFLTAVFSFYKLTESNSSAWWYLTYSVSFLLAVFTHWFVGIYLILISFMCLFKINRSKRNILMLNFLILACLAVFFMWKIKFGRQSTEVFFLSSFTPAGFWKLFFNWFLFGNTLWKINVREAPLNALLEHPTILIVQAAFLFIFIHGLVVSLRDSKNQQSRNNILFLFTLPLFLLGASFFGFKQIYIERYLLIVLPFFFIVMSKGSLSFRNNYTRILSTALIIIFGIAALIGFFRTQSDRATIIRPPNWRSAIQYFSREMKDTEQPLLIFTTNAGQIMYYQYRLEGEFRKEKMPQLKLQLCSYDKVNSSGTRAVYELLSGRKTFYFLRDKTRYINFDDLLKIVLGDNRVSLVDRQFFRGLVIFKFKVN